MPKSGGLMVVMAIAVASCSAGSTAGPTASSTATVASSTRSSITDSFARALPAPLASGATGGVIHGQLGYPSDFLPAQAVYAISTDGSEFYRAETVVGQGTYSLLEVLPDDYYVFSIPRALTPTTASSARTNSPNRFGAAYTNFVRCGLVNGCGDHGPLTVRVAAGQTISGVDPTDWYADPGTFPLIPGSPPVVALESPPASFRTAQDAGKYSAQANTLGLLIDSRGSCQVNVACVWLTGEHDGNAAAYLTGAAGSNYETQVCAFYVFAGASGWHSLNSRCGPGPTPFPAIGSSGAVHLGMGEQGCVNVHSSPSITAQVVGCLPPGTEVTIDGGPSYVPNSGMPLQDYLWHVAGKGWVVHQYLA